MKKKSKRIILAEAKFETHRYYSCKDNREICAFWDDTTFGRQFIKNIIPEMYKANKIRLIAEIL